MNNRHLKQYFLERTLEILHKETIDTYRQRHHNAYTSLVELRDTVKRWEEKKVKTLDTIRILGEECVDLLNADDCLVYEDLSKELLILEIKLLLKSTDKYPNNTINRRVLFCLNQCIEKNKQIYLTHLLNNVNAIILDENDISDDKTTPILEQIDKYLSAIFVQLVYEGYTKQALYILLKSQSKKGFDSFFKQFENIAKLKNRDYVIIWKVLIPNCIGVELETLGLRQQMIEMPEINDFIKKKYNKFLANTEGHYYYYIDRSKAKDKYAALKQSREHMMSLIDNLHLGYSLYTIHLPEKAMVIEKRETTHWANSEPTSYFMDGISSGDYSTSVFLSEKINTIQKTNHIDAGVKERLKSAIRHLNYGDHNTELEQRFINYWIALEFIFSSPMTDDNTYTRLKTNLINVLACSYIKRNMNYLETKLKADGWLDTSTDLWTSGTNIDEIAEEPDLPLVWKYKLKKMKSRLLGHSDKRKSYYTNHVNNLERHITRIYNMRNALIHEAGINQDIENITSNLRYYLVFILDQMIYYFSNTNLTNNKTQASLDDFFNTYINYRKMIEVDYDLNIIKSIPIAKNLW